ncbi:MAG: exodeoxyribonuclease VII large subunit [Alphaproteobacteria bacterium]
MTDSTTTLAGNIPEYSVGELSFAVKRSIEEGFERVRVRGEVSSLRRPGSGHVYFSLKDENAVLAAVCWRGVAARLRYPPEDGLEMVCTGRLTTYPGRSQYQIVVEAVEPAGEGALLKLLDERRKQLAAEGLFDEARKRALPFLPEIVGVVTSPTGAVIRDILHRLADRFPRHVLIWPARVQGEGAAEEIAAAIAGFNRLDPGGAVPRPDLLIVARGGGSLEDLWAFNEEVVVRAAAASEIPLISAVGHETDVTLIDFAADKRAPTPTAAAEMAVPVRAELMARVLDLERRLESAMARRFESWRGELRGLARGLPEPRGLIELAMQRLDHAGETLARTLALVLERGRARVAGLAGRLRHPREQIAAARARLALVRQRLDGAATGFLGAEERRFAAVAAGLRAGALVGDVTRKDRVLDDLGIRLSRAGVRTLADARRRIEAAARLLDGYGYQQVLERGFVLARDDSGRPLTSAAQATPGLGLALTFHDGQRHATVDRAPAARKPRARPAPAKRGGQGKLF